MENVFIKTNEIPSWIADEYFYGKDIVSIDDLICAMDDLKSELEYLKEDYEDFKKDVEENYKPIPPEEQIGYDERTW